MSGWREVCRWEISKADLHPQVQGLEPDTGWVTLRAERSAMGDDFRVSAMDEYGPLQFRPKPPSETARWVNGYWREPRSKPVETGAVPSEDTTTAPASDSGASGEVVVPSMCLSCRVNPFMQADVCLERRCEAPTYQGFDPTEERSGP